MADPTDGYSKIDTIDLPGGVGGHGDIVAYDTDTKTVWIAQSPDNNVVVLDTKTNTVEATIPNIGNANGIDFSPKYAFVADVTNDSLDVINKRTFATVDKVPLTGTTPDGVAYIPSTKQVTVASDDANTLSFINAKAPFTQTSTTQLVPNPSPPGPDVQLYVPQTDRIYQPDDQNIDVINPHTGAITKTFDVLPGSSASVNVKPPVYDPVSNDLIVGTTNNELLVVNAAKGTVLNTIPVKGSVDEGVVDTATRTAFFAGSAGNVYAVNLDTDKLVGTIPTEAGTHSLTVDPTNNDLYVYEGNSNTVDVFAPNQAVACYCTGTLIRTARGDVPVEHLAAGDLVVTASGAHRPIRWIGHRAYAGRFANANPEALPICFKAGSLADGVPARDLWVSPKHAMFLNGALVAAELLVNGVSVIKAECVERVEYWHVELDSHDVLLAEGAPSESFVDDNSRGMFHNASAFWVANLEAVGVEAVYCAPRLEDGYQLQAVRQAVAARAGIADAAPECGTLQGYIDAIEAGAVRGWARSALHPAMAVCLDLVVDGRVVAQGLANCRRADLDAAGYGAHGFAFAIPAGADGRRIEVRRSADGARMKVVMDRAA